MRHYGFLSPNSRLSVEAVRWLVTLHNGGLFQLLAKQAEAMPVRPKPRCAECGGPLRIVAFIPRRAPVAFDTS